MGRGCGHITLSNNSKVVTTILLKCYKYHVSHLLNFYDILDKHFRQIFFIFEYEIS